MARERMPLTLGLRLDVLDNEGIWNTGTIVDVAQDEEKDEELVEIKYDGWGDEYNEWVAVSSQRLAPLHMFTIVKKCWAKLTKWPWWPAFVVLRAPTKRGAVESLEAETKVYVEFFDSFDEDKRSRCWMQRKSVVSFDDNFEERAAKNVGKNFHKFVESTQRALASSSPLLFAGSGTLPIEYSSKSPLTYTAQKQKLGATEWYDAYTSFSERYRVLYGYAANKTKASSNGAARSAPAVAVDEDAEVAEGTEYADDDESDEKEAAEEEEASGGEDDDDDDEAVESARGRRSARAAPPKRKLPARASTRRNAQKRVKAIEQLLQSTKPTPRVSASSTTARATRVAARSAAPAPAPALVSATPAHHVAVSNAPILLTLDDDEDGDDNDNSVSSASAPAASASQSESTTTAAHLPPLTDWKPSPGSQIYLLPSEPSLPFTSPAASTVRHATGSPAKKDRATVSMHHSPSTSTSVHRRKSPRTTAICSDVTDVTLRSFTVRPDAATPVSTAGTAPLSNPEALDKDSCDDGTDAQFWSGGSRYEIAGEPWQIQRWLLHGLKQKIEQR